MTHYRDMKPQLSGVDNGPVPSEVVEPLSAEEIKILREIIKKNKSTKEELC